jgi:SAM-dependent methyltransferase|tara:strand:+ start:52 stop:1281 length:1230 start_codon:yes stop_codon:yes gene_type:complete
MKLSKNNQKCQFSNKKDLKLIISLGYLPPVNEFLKINSINSQSIFFPTDLVYSQSSKLVQLSTIVNKSIVFPKSYPYTSSTTKILRDNFAELSNECEKLINFNSKDLIVDIGSNDGNLLSNFKKIRRLGVTPENIGKLAIKKGIPTLLKYFDRNTANLIQKKYGKAKIITATNVFAHIDNITELMKNVLKVLKNDGVFVTESHYLMPLIKDLQYDTIYHEHLRYYSLTSLKNIFDKFKLEIIHAKEIPTHGGSIRVYVAKKNNYKKSKLIKKILNKEKKLLNKKKFLEFRDRVVASKLQLLTVIKKIKDKKKLIYGVGAPSRATTLVNYTGLTKEIIDCICEVKNSYKVGHYMPGTNIPVVSEDIIFKKKPDYLLMLSWHISKDLIKIFKKKGYKGKFIIPLPKVKILS